MWRKIMVVAVALLGWTGAYAEGAFVEGKDYTLITHPQLMPAGHDVVVQEFFWYGCPHCYHLLPLLDSWAKTKPAYVELDLIPAALTPLWQIDARAFYAAQSRGVALKLHEAMFDSIHKDQNTSLVNDIPSIVKFYESHGAGVHFAELMNSMVILGKVNYAAQLAKDYAIEGVPALIIDGKYLVDYHAGEPMRMMQVVAELVRREHAVRH